MDEEIADVVREHGWYAANVSDGTPPFVYTIGLMKTCCHPEFITFGLNAGNAHALFSQLVRDIRDGGSFTEPGVPAGHARGADGRTRGPARGRP